MCLRFAGVPTPVPPNLGAAAAAVFERGKSMDGISVWRFFACFVRALERTFFKFDHSTRTYCGRSAFGTIITHMTVPESNARGGPHAHIVVWTRELRARSIDHALQNDAFKAGLLAFLSSCSQASLYDGLVAPPDGAIPAVNQAGRDDASRLALPRVLHADIMDCDQTFAAMHEASSPWEAARASLTSSASLCSGNQWPALPNTVDEWRTH